MIAADFADYIASLTASLSTVPTAVLGSNLFIGQAPSGNRAPDDIYWFVQNPSSLVANVTDSSVKSYSFILYYRSRDYEDVYGIVNALEVAINKGCQAIPNYDTIDVAATTLMVDEDLDLADRKVGSLQIVAQVNQ